VSHIGSIGLAGNLTSYAMTLPAGLANNDVLVLGVAHSSTVTVSSISKTAITTGQVVEGGLVVDYYAVLLQATDSSTTFTVAMSGAASKTAVADIFRGNDTTTPATFVTRHAQDTVRQSPSVTPTATSDIWAFCAERTATGTTTSFTAPAGITKTQDQVNTSTAPDNAVCGYATAVAAGTVGPYDWTVNGGVTTAREVGITAIINPAGASPTRTMLFKKADGTWVPVVSMQFLDSSGTWQPVTSWSTL
jgi:hypothetical protein